GVLEAAADGGVGVNRKDAVHLLTAVELRSRLRIEHVSPRRSTRAAYFCARAARAVQPPPTTAPHGRRGTPSAAAADSRGGCGVMTMRPMRPCGTPGCPELVRPPVRHCDR